jgi:HlyD family secretion protein
MRTWKIPTVIVVVGVLVALGTWFAKRSSAKFATLQGVVPTARVERGDLRLDVFTTGELQTEKTVSLFAPPVGGATLQIVHLDPTGTAVKPGDVVLEFDPSEQEYNVEKNRSDLEEAEQEMAKAKYQAAVQDADDRLAVLKAKFAVRQAELDVQKNPLLAAIDAKKNLLALDEAKRALAQLEQDIKSHATSNQAAADVARAKFNKAKIEMERAEQNIRNMTIRSPIAGVVKVRENYMATGGFFFSGMTIPQFRNGDQAQPGTPVVDVLGMERMEITARLTETDRPSVHVGERVEIRVDAISGAVFSGTIKTISGMATRSMWEANPTRHFDATIDFDHPDPSLRPGFTAHLTLIGDGVKDALYVPRVAIFEKNGEPIVYVKKGTGFAEQEVKLKAETSARAVIEGLPKGAEVALVSPAAQTQPAGGKPEGPAVQGASK